MKSKLDSISKARNYCFNLLKFRPRSRKELVDKLNKKRFNLDTINQVVSYLEEKQFIDDKYFASAWVGSRINRPLGLNRLKQELRLKGIDEQIIEDLFTEVNKGYKEDEVVFRLAKERLKKQPAVPPQKKKQRIYNYLLRRGFSPSVVINVINQLKI